MDPLIFSEVRLPVSDMQIHSLYTHALSRPRLECVFRLQMSLGVPRRGGGGRYRYLVWQASDSYRSYVAMPME